MFELSLLRHRNSANRFDQPADGVLCSAQGLWFAAVLLRFLDGILMVNAVDVLVHLCQCFLICVAAAFGEGLFPERDKVVMVCWHSFGITIIRSECGSSVRIVPLRVTVSLSMPSNVRRQNTA